MCLASCSVQKWTSTDAAQRLMFSDGCCAENLGFHNGRPLAALVIFRCCLQWRTFQADRTVLFDKARAWSLQDGAPCATVHYIFLFHFLFLTLLRAPHAKVGVCLLWLVCRLDFTAVSSVIEG